MDELISRQQAINVIERMRAYIGHNMERAVGAAFIEILNCVGEDIGRLPSIQPATDTNVGAKLSTNLAEVGTDCISRQMAIDALRVAYWDDNIQSAKDDPCIVDAMTDWAIRQVKALPSAQREIKQQAINSSDCIDRRAALDALRKMQTYKLFSGDDMLLIDQAGAMTELMLLSPAQLDTYWKEQCQSYEQTINKLRESLSTQPEIIRCKDCKHWIPYDWMFSEVWQSRNMNDYPEDEIGCKLCDMSMKANDFCSRADRREVTE